MAGPGDPRYTQKIRAKRIALNYFKRPHPFRRWRLILSIAVPVVAGAWLLVYAGQGNLRIYNPDTVSTAHKMFESDCKVCHGPGPAPGSTTLAGVGGGPGYWARVSDNACTACHAGPQHHSNEAFTPPCASCHIEHRGRERLMEAADRHCTQCHGDLKTKEGKSEFTASIRGLANHPEFAIDVKPDTGAQPPAGQKLMRVRLDDKAKAVDHTAMKLNHQRHLKPGLQGIDKVMAKTGTLGIVKAKTTEGKDAQALGCTFCHRPDAAWQYMQPITYKQHCADCHELATGIGPLLAPHEPPPFARAFVLGAASDLFTSCRGKIPADDAGKALRETCEAVGIAAAAPAPTPGAPAAPAEEAPRGRRRGAFAPELLPEAIRNAALGLEPADLGQIVLAQRRRGGSEEEAAPAAPSAPAEQDSGGRRRRRGGEEEAPPPAAGGGGGGAAGGSAGAAGAWAMEQLANAENLLFKTKSDGCQKCHTFDPAKAAQPLPEVIPPKIPARWLPHSKFDHGPHRPLACGECHKAAASTKTEDVLLPAINSCRDCHQPKGGARGGCVECHRYHDKSKERDADGPYKVPAILSGVGRKHPAGIR